MKTKTLTLGTLLILSLVVIGLRTELRAQQASPGSSSSTGGGGVPDTDALPPGLVN